MGQTTVYPGKGTVLGKRDTTLPHRHTVYDDVWHTSTRNLFRTQTRGWMKREWWGWRQKCRKLETPSWQMDDNPQPHVPSLTWCWRNDHPVRTHMPTTSQLPQLNLQRLYELNLFTYQHTHTGAIPAWNCASSKKRLVSNGWARLSPRLVDCHGLIR